MPFEADPGQLVWGTDRPHPSIPVPMPDDADLADMSETWLADEAMRKAVFVTNPSRLYGF